MLLIKQLVGGYYGRPKSGRTQYSAVCLTCYINHIIIILYFTGMTVKSMKKIRYCGSQLATQKRGRSFRDRRTFRIE